MTRELKCYARKYLFNFQGDSSRGIELKTDTRHMESKQLNADLNPSLSISAINVKD